MSGRKLPPPRAGFGKGTTDSVQLHSALIRQARKTGQLNLSNRHYSEVPSDVWRVNLDTPDEGSSLSMDAEGDRWWEQMALTKLILASNIITSLSEDISFLSHLTSLDVHDNKLSSLPDALAQLDQLQYLNISHNAFAVMPGCIRYCHNLRGFQCQHNQIQNIPDSFFDLLCKLDKLDLSNNKLDQVGGGIGYLVQLVTLNVSHNQLGVLPHEIGRLASLQTLECSHNMIHTLPDELGRLSCLQILYLRHNRITHLPELAGCSALKELHLGNNAIQGLTIEHLSNLPSLHSLDVRDNRISKIPDEITLLQHLERLDLTNNALTTLPYELGTMQALKTIVLDGNPLKAIRRDIIMRGTNELKKYLRSRLEVDPDIPVSQSGSLLKSPGMSGVIGGSQNLIDPHAVKSSKSLDFSEKGVAELPEDIWKVIEESDLSSINLSKNKLTEFPTRLCSTAKTLTELVLGFNKLTEIHPCIGTFEKLNFLDLRNNQLFDLPSELQNLTVLREIALSNNRFVRIPPCVFKLKKLETLLLNENRLEEIDAEDIQRLPVLATLDLTNNNLKHIQPEVGLCEQLRSLQLEGNALRQPRPAIIAKGTNAILEFLRGRILAKS